MTAVATNSFNKQHQQAASAASTDPRPVDGEVPTTDAVETTWENDPTKGVPYTSIGEIPKLVQDLRDAGNQGIIPVEERIAILERMKGWLIEDAEAIRAAEFADLRRPPKFSDQIRMGCVATINHTLANLREWIKDEPCLLPPSPMVASYAEAAYIRKEAVGVVLVIGTWNFPLPLHLKPVIQAISAGCRVVLKLNEVCQNTSEVMYRGLLKSVLKPAIKFRGAELAGSSQEARNGADASESGAKKESESAAAGDEGSGESPGGFAENRTMGDEQGGMTSKPILKAPSHDTDVALSAVAERDRQNAADTILDKPKTPFLQLVYGGIPQATTLLEQKFDKIFYTGNCAVGKIVYQAAAEKLTPCVLELGGRNPVIITETANLETAVIKLVDTKLMNVGQFCVSPNHIWVPAKFGVKQFADQYFEVLARMCGRSPQLSHKVSRIISPRHFDRILDLLGDSDHGGEIVKVSRVDRPDRDDLYMPVTLVLEPRKNSKLMQEEIFGPIVPVLLYSDLSDVLEWERSQPDPLALYIFSSHKGETAKIIENTRSGGVCVNDCIAHMLGETMPFGGIGESGFGNYRGEWGFKAFTHERSVMKFGAAELGGESRRPPPL